MAGEKNRAIVAVLTNLTETQAAEISKDLMKSKQKHAEHGRGIISVTQESNVKKILRKGTKEIEEDK